ncbi:DUF4003 family protein [Bacillus benzoevorans]|uniref:DUF4003 domain-containing protein n=1 Tax=Bacillus benzoevorans TaxID=1456 RepID=A0A7X0LUW9_9BACI|nr:DUF4003 family protein [Bacillus benzoevorans]MBB6445391.1 hypothetical protein [Bacillus benzoevorans]
MNNNLFEENIEILRSVSKWVDSRLIFMTAAQLTAKGKRINASEFQETVNAVKKSASAFSPLRTIYFSIAGLIYAQENQTHEAINRLQQNYKELKSAGLRSSIYTYIAALLMEENVDARRVKEIYDGMRKYHRFLTSYDDYPAAVMMAKQSAKMEDLLESSEKYYITLNEKGFNKGNDLQLLANMLVMNGSFTTDIVNKVIYAKETFEHNRIKIKVMQYPAIGLIALSNKTNEALSLSRELSSMNAFRWYKNMAVTIAAIFVSQEYTDAPAGLTAAIEAMIQAQQAAVIAATAAAVSASSSSSGGE